LRSKDLARLKMQVQMQVQVLVLVTQPLSACLA
jgi:hypothetical protein